jgi:glycosyltransferase involved in cell wall biosynthesis
MRLLWLGDLASTGFGTVTADTGREFVKLGVDVRFVSQNDLGELVEPFASRTLDMTTFDYNEHGITGVGDFLPDLIAGIDKGYTLYNGDKWGAWKPEVVFLLGDFYGMREMVEKVGLAEFAKVPSFHYAPIEGHDLPGVWKPYWDVIKPIAMTKFGQAEIGKIVGYKPPLVYHGVDAETFHPVSPSNPITIAEKGAEPFNLISKAACKMLFFGDPSATVVLRTDTNMPRKGYPVLLRAMAPVMRERPDVHLALHCHPFSQGGYLPEWTAKYPDLEPRIRMRAESGYLPREALVALYNSADLYVSTSAEGFGLTIAEALACGVPAVGIDYSAVPEVIGPAGQTVAVGQYIDNPYGHHWAFPDEAAFGKAVAYLLDRPHKRQELGRLGPGHVAKNFRWDVAAERFVRIAQERLGATESAPESERVLVAA